MKAAWQVIVVIPGKEERKTERKRENVQKKKERKKRDLLTSLKWFKKKIFETGYSGIFISKPNVILTISQIK